MAELPGYDNWKTHNPDDDRCEFCGADPRESRHGWAPSAMIDIPTEDDFNALPDMMAEALANNRLNNLLAKAPTEVTRNGETFTTTSPEMAAAWVDDAIQAIRLMVFAAEIDSWEQEEDRRLSILNKYFPDQYERICEELWSARENVKQLRW